MAATLEHAARVLGLTDDSTLDDVRRRRRALALKYHPDRTGDASRAGRHMARINAAADTLMVHLKKRVALRFDHEHMQRRFEVARAQARAAQQAKPERQPIVPAIRPSQPPAIVPKRSYVADVTRAQLAATSYSSVRDMIGKASPQPSVDIRVLCYPGAA